MCLFVTCMQVPIEASRGHQTPGATYIQLWATNMGTGTWTGILWKSKCSWLLGLLSNKASGSTLASCAIHVPSEVGIPAWEMPITVLDPQDQKLGTSVSVLNGCCVWCRQTPVLILLCDTRKFKLRSVPEKQARQDVFNQVFSGSKSLLAPLPFTVWTIPAFSSLILQRKKIASLLNLIKQARWHLFGDLEYTQKDTRALFWFDIKSQLNLPQSLCCPGNCLLLRERGGCDCPKGPGRRAGAY